MREATETPVLNNEKQTQQECLLQSLSLCHNSNNDGRKLKMTVQKRALEIFSHTETQVKHDSRMNGPEGFFSFLNCMTWLGF